MIKFEWMCKICGWLAIRMIGEKQGEKNAPYPWDSHRIRGDRK